MKGLVIAWSCVLLIMLASGCGIFPPREETNISSESETFTDSSDSNKATEIPKSQPPNKKIENPDVDIDIPTGNIANSANNNSPAALYLLAIDALINQYGEGQIVDDMISGVFMSRLIDFDGDGINELYCCYGYVEFYDRWGRPVYRYGQDIYGYDGESLIKIVEDFSVSNPGTDVCPTISILTKEGKTYLIHEYEMTRGEYYTIENNKLIVFMDYTIDFWQEGSIETAINGEVMTLEEQHNTLGDFNAKGVLETIYLDIAREEVASALFAGVQATIGELQRLSNQ